MRVICGTRNSLFNAVKVLMKREKNELTRAHICGQRKTHKRTSDKNKFDQRLASTIREVNKIGAGSESMSEKCV